MNNPKFKTLLPVKAPLQVEISYKNNLLGIIKELRSVVIEEFGAILKEFYYGRKVSDSLATRRVDDEESISKKLERKFSDIRKISEVTYNGVEGLSKSYVEKINDYNRSKVLKGIKVSKDDKSLMGRINIATLLDNEGIRNAVGLCIQENTNLIKSISQQYLLNIEKSIYGNLTGNLGYKSLIEAINNCGQKEVSRVKLIARDQTAKINSNLDKIRSQSLGVVGYQWVTAHDSRVRASHKKFDGEYYLWEKFNGREKDRPIAPNGKPFNDPPEENGVAISPGTSIQCRCVARSVIRW